MPQEDTSSEQCVVNVLHQVLPQSPPPKDKKGVKVGGRAAIYIPKIRPLAPNHKTLVFMDNQKRQPPISTVRKAAETGQPI